MNTLDPQQWARNRASESACSTETGRFSNARAFSSARSYMLRQRLR